MIRGNLQSRMLTALLLAMIPPAATAQSWSSMVVFGDSLSDTGNYYQASGEEIPESPPNYEGRFSDGPLWVEYLSDILADPPLPLTVWAMSGARTFDDEFPWGVLHQVDLHLDQTTLADPDALYVIFAGTNDYVSLVFGGGSSEPDSPFVQEVLDNLEQAVRTLHDAGGQDFLVVNLPDLARFPFAGQEIAPDLHDFVLQHNQGLETLLPQLEIELGVRIVEGDAWGAFGAMLDNPESYGFLSADGVCLQGSDPCPNPDQFLFWDVIHPSTRAHEIFADHLHPQLITPSAVHETWWLYY